MPAQRTFGMDHPHHEWSPIISRPTLRWPNNAPVALCVILVRHPGAGTHGMAGAGRQLSGRQPVRRFCAAGISRLRPHFPPGIRAPGGYLPPAGCAREARHNSHHRHGRHHRRKLSVPGAALPGPGLRDHRTRHLRKPHDYQRYAGSGGAAIHPDLHRRIDPGHRRGSPGLAGAGIRRVPTHAAAVGRSRPALRLRLGK